MERWITIETADLGLGAYLLVLGGRLTDLSTGPNGIVSFTFADVPADARESYRAGGQVGARAFYRALSALRTQMFRLREQHGHAPLHARVSAQHD